MPLDVLSTGRHGAPGGQHPLAACSCGSSCGGLSGRLASLWTGGFLARPQVPVCWTTALRGRRLRHGVLGQWPGAVLDPWPWGPDQGTDLSLNMEPSSEAETMAGGGHSC